MPWRTRPGWWAEVGRPRQVSDEEMLEAARRVFFARGVQAPVSDVAEALGVSHTAVFARFRTKEALLIAAFAPPVTLPFLHELEAGPDARPVRAQLLGLARLFVGYFEQLDPRWAVLQAAGIGLDKVFAGRVRPSPLAAQEAMREWVERARVKKLLRVASPGVFAWTFLGALHQRVFQGGLKGTKRVEVGMHELRALVALLTGGTTP